MLETCLFETQAHIIVHVWNWLSGSTWFQCCPWNLHPNICWVLFICHVTELDLLIYGDWKNPHWHCLVYNDVFTIHITRKCCCYSYYDGATVREPLNDTIVFHISFRLCDVNVLSGNQKRMSNWCKCRSVIQDWRFFMGDVIKM